MTFAFRSIALLIGSVMISDLCGRAFADSGDPSKDGSPISATQPPDLPEQHWNLHLQNTDVVQGYPGFPAQYSGPNSLPAGGETRETVSIDLTAGLRLWRGAEFHIDGIFWQGYGVGNTFGAEAYPNGEANHAGTAVGNANFSHLLIRQTIGLGGEQENVADDSLHLAGKQDISRITITLGRMSAKDIFDNNAYANDGRNQFMNWSFLANASWDWPSDDVGYTSGLAIELNKPDWTLRYGFFQVPRVSNGEGIDLHIFEAWSMVTEFERRYTIGGHPGSLRLLASLERANMGSYADSLAEVERPVDITATRDYRLKYGFGINADQEIFKDVGVFTRLGWSNGRTEDTGFDDVDHSASLGLSIKGSSWSRPDDTVGIAGGINGITKVHREFLAAGGTGILSGDGNLSYSPEKILETYYEWQFRKGVHFTVDYQFVMDPVFNRDRGPVSVFAGRLHWEF